MGSMNEGAGMAAMQPLPEEKSSPASAAVCTLRNWLGDLSLNIPHYQRPYKWGLAQVQQLLRDIELQAQTTAQDQGASSYRMGTVVVHVEQAEDREAQPQRVLHHIVDGQQRTVTLLLVLHALRAEAKLVPEGQRPSWQQELLTLKLFEPQFPSPLSHQLVQANYQAVARHIRQAQWGQMQASFLLERCEVVRVQLHSLTEAFQFFDAQNGRGKALCVHDLLKAFHLRALRPAELALQGQAVQAWEKCSQDDLERLFARFLFQTRQRSRGRDAEFFGKRHVGVFKGISLESHAAAPMSRTWRMLDDAVHLLESHTGTRGRVWPCQLDAPVVNGLRFFDWVQHYWGMGFHLKQEKDQLPPWAQKLQQPLAGEAHEILLTLGRYAGRERKGDSHVRAVFDALLMYYLDKFGEQGLSQAVELAFVWAYARLLNRRVMVGSMDKFVNESGVNPFAVLRDAVTSQDFLGMALPAAFYGNSYQGGEQSRPKGLATLEGWMRKLGYWQQITQQDAQKQGAGESA
ncbi:DUF262 domain-containing protein [Comamonas sp. CMM02]|uniref:DUF262 domain-containing protein n=1 Tax=Comamonas sp. CMM02 TaxID=2769307 RepID=UPI00177E615B|nr:DUF262 domain-containing protein [Comamonas sp. CMM02]MBD9402306.1 DUF262 domain-containing protein [Comamonas sp. CMM02]